jgi:hypothetical protein
LKLPQEDWPSGEAQPDEDLVMQERRTGIVSSLLCTSDNADWYYIFSNDYNRVVRVLAWVGRFVSGCCKQRIGQDMQKILQFKEIFLAEKCIIRYVQRESFAGLQDEKFASLNPFLDEEGIIRLRTRIVKRADMGDFAIPAVLLSRHPIVERLVMSTHIMLCHVGAQGYCVSCARSSGF